MATENISGIIGGAAVAGGTPSRMIAITESISGVATVTGSILWVAECQSTGGGIEVGGDTDIEFINPVDLSSDDYINPLVIGGRSVYKYIDPIEISVSGGIIVGGKSTIKFSYDIITAQGVGGILVGGQSVIKILSLIYDNTGSGGIKVKGDAIVVIKENAFSIIQNGGIKVSGSLYDEVNFIIAESEYPWNTISIKGIGGAVISGDPDFQVNTQQAVIFDSSSVSVKVTGEPVVVIIKAIPFSEITAESGEDVLTDDIFDTWVLSSQSQLASIYTGFNFNSYAVFESKGYGAGPAGIFLLEGDDDEGAQISSGVRIKKTNFRITSPKRLRSIDINSGNDDAQIRVFAGDVEGTFFKTREWMISRDLIGDEFIIDIINFNEISNLTILPLVLVKR